MAETTQERLERLEREMGEIDRAICEQFEQSHKFLVEAMGKVDERFGRVEHRLSRVEGRLTSFEANVMQRFDRTDARMQAVLDKLTGFVDAQSAINRVLLERFAVPPAN